MIGWGIPNVESAWSSAKLVPHSDIKKRSAKKTNGLLLTFINWRFAGLDTVTGESQYYCEKKAGE